ncbi:hypothetical protein G9F32_13650 [Acinetobacter sp. 194]|uniref:hypothetical protein n=1 Tax=Acinetobacter shaoyimingii TaxID=2715164 RepID=UPI00140C985A|nr:hypothetical protein [Acinetobacter shaoyimingii]NHB59047.1 hypothetical protein [Acinetobacter shaoyimingii]
MNLLKLVKLSIVLVSLLGCNNKVYEQSSDKYPFEFKMRALLGSDLEIINSLKRNEVEVSYFDLSELQSKNQINNIVNRLESDGWKLKGKGRGVDTYCLGLNNRINIVVASAGTLYDFKGRELPENNSDGVLYSYNKWGEDLCE